MEEKSQVSCQGYKAKLVTVARISKRNVVKIRKKNTLKSRVQGIRCLVNARGSELSDSSEKIKNG